jgi:2-C-methyl-D-erythritol 4-phosphate cytidylyltransferase
VWNGLRATTEASELVAIHDAARPCTAVHVISSTIAAARERGAAVAAQRVTDTLKRSADGATIESTVERSGLWSVQTPQVFRRSTLIKALQEAMQRGLTLTDDTAACELIGQSVWLVESRLPNPKITYPEDIPCIEWLLGNRSANLQPPERDA